MKKIFLIGFFFILFISVSSLYSKTITEFYNSLNQYSSEKSWDKCEALAIEATNSYPEETGFHTYLNYILRSLKKNKEALDQIEMIMNKYPDSREILENYRVSLLALGWERVDQKRKEEAFQFFQKAYKYAENGEWELNAYGYIQRELSNYSESIEILEKGTSLYPTNQYISGNLFYCYFNYGLFFKDQTNYNKAEEYYKKADKLIPDQEWLLLNYGYLLHIKGEYAESLKMLKKGMSLYPTNQYYKNDILYTYLDYERGAAKSGDTNQALKISLEALKSYQSYPWLLNDISVYYFSKKDYMDSVNALIRAARTKEAPDAEKEWGFNFKNNLYNNAFQILFKLAEKKEFTAASEIVKKIEKYFPDSYLTFSLKGNLLFLTGNVKAGIKTANLAYGAYLKEFPGHKNEIVTVDLPLRGMVIVGGNDSDSAITHAGLNRYCFDLTGCDSTGNVMIKPGNELGGNDNFIGFGREIISPVEGIVEIVVDDMVDKTPQTNYSLGDGNYVSVRDARGYHYIFMHNRMHSARVRPGDKVKPGDVLAELGNTGMTSIPHLHFGVYAKEWVLSIPVRFKNFYKIKKDGRKVKISEGIPASGDIIEPAR